MLISFGILSRTHLPIWLSFSTMRLTSQVLYMHQPQSPPLCAKISLQNGLAGQRVSRFQLDIRALSLRVYLNPYTVPYVVFYDIADMNFYSRSHCEGLGVTLTGSSSNLPANTNPPLYNNIDSFSCNRLWYIKMGISVSYLTYLMFTENLTRWFHF